MSKPHRTFLILAVIMMFSAHAMAADAPPPPDQDALAWVKALYQAVVDKQWGIVAGVVLIGVVYPLRRWGGALIPWLKTPFGGLVLAFAIALAGTLGIALAAGAPITLGLVVTALTTAATAAGVWEWLKAHLPGMQAAADKAAADKAAADKAAEVS